MLVSWLLKTTIMLSLLPAERVLTWLVLSFAKLGFTELVAVVVAAAGAVVAPAVPAVTAVQDIASPVAPIRAHNRAVLMVPLPHTYCDMPLISGMIRTLAGVITKHNGVVSTANRGMRDRRLAVLRPVRARPCGGADEANRAVEQGQ